MVLAMVSDQVAKWHRTEVELISVTYYIILAIKWHEKLTLLYAFRRLDYFSLHLFV